MVTKDLQTLTLKFDQVMFNNLIFTILFIYLFKILKTNLHCRTPHAQHVSAGKIKLKRKPIYIID